MGNSTVAMSVRSISLFKDKNKTMKIIQVCAQHTSLVVKNSNVERHAYQKATKFDDFLYC